MRYSLPETTHHYKGFVIKGGECTSKGGYVLGGRHYVEPGIQRNYVIWKDGKRIFKFCIIKTLRDAKAEIDDYIIRNGILL